MSAGKYLSKISNKDLFALKYVSLYVSGTIILNSPKNSVETIIEEVVQEFIGRGHMNRDHKQKFKNILLSSSRHHLTVASALTRKKTVPELFSSNQKRRFSRANSFVADLTGSSSTQFKKASSFHLMNMARTPRSDEMESLNGINMDDKHERDNQIKFYVASAAEDSFDTGASHNPPSKYGASSSIMNLLRIKSLHPNKSHKVIEIEDTYCFNYSLN